MPAKKEFNLDNFKGGALPKPKDEREFEFSEVISCGAVEAISEADWDKGYDSEAELGVKLKHENQNGSLSCVAQATSKVGEGLNFVETGKLEDFSAKRIYLNIHLPNGGAYTEDGARWGRDKGFMPEANCPSYENGNPPSEAFMTKEVPLSDEALALEKVYASKSYFFARNIDEVASAIKNYKFVLMSATGNNAGWRTGDLIPPTNGGDWGHAFCGKAFKRRLNPKTGTMMKAIKIHNSWGEYWGEKGDGWLYEDYFLANYVHFSLVLIDKNNLTTMGLNIKLVKTANNSAVYLMGLGDGKYHPLVNARVALDLFGKDWASMKIEIVDKIPADQVSYMLGGIVS